VRPGKTFERHYQAMQKSLFRRDTWNVFLSKRPLTAVFAKTWARLFFVSVGLVMYFTPGGSVSLTFEDVRTVAGHHASVLRFQALTLRNGQANLTSIEMPVSLTTFGVLYRGCAITTPHTVSQTQSYITLSFAEHTAFDGWFLVTAHDTSPDFDPTEYVVEYLDQNSEWRKVGSSDKSDVCGARVSSIHSGVHLEMTTERDTTVKFSFVTDTCLLPIYMIIVGQKMRACSLFIAPFIAVCLRNALGPPVQVIAFTSIFAGGSALMGLFLLWLQGRASHLPFTSVSLF
jgi:hypothetical protein